MRKMISKIMALGSSQLAIPRGTHDGFSHLQGVPDELAIEIDANGSPITVSEASWFICFVPGLQKQWWHRFTNAKHKHVFAMRMVGENTWILVEPWWTRMMVNVLTLDEAVKFLRWGSIGHILKVQEHIPGKGSQARGWSNCAVLMSFLLGRSYWTWTPHGLYRRLRTELTTTCVDLPQFLSEHLEWVANKTAEQTLSAPLQTDFDSLEDALLSIGYGIATASISPTANGLYKVAVSESRRFRNASEKYWKFGPEKAVEVVQEQLDFARQRQEIQLENCATTASQFVAMLRGDLQLKTLFAVQPPPNNREIQLHVRAAVTTLLNGVSIT
ncbi:TetR/AcrR family transcriptional regulator C-terminal domain-containing protein [Pseudomonas fluorescens]|uniref:TetR/AcrR family transcriptional regulator C-terminal domain-containing protein n=1 Tax=Pseudomonas fluorescens TaxID=294 RepID=UPI0035231BE2